MSRLRGGFVYNDFLNLCCLNYAIIIYDSRIHTILSLNPWQVFQILTILCLETITDLSRKTTCTMLEKTLEKRRIESIWGSAVSVASGVRLLNPQLHGLFFTIYVAESNINGIKQKQFFIIIKLLFAMPATHPPLIHS